MILPAPDTTLTAASLVIPGYDAAYFRWPPYVCYGPHAPVTEQTITYQGRAYLLRAIHKNIIVFRDAARNVSEWTYFLQYTPADTTAATLTPEQFTYALERGEVGRMAGCKPGGKYGSQIFMLLLSPDGTGLYRNFQDDLTFTWDWRQMGLDAPEDLLAADFIELDMLKGGIFSRYCADIVEHQISKRLKNFYVDPGDLPNSPLVYTCGSEEELKRITTWICHSDPDIFSFDGERRGVHIWYRSPAEKFRVCFKIMRFGGQKSYSEEPIKSSRLKTLVCLAYKYNAFTGWRWDYRNVRTPRRIQDYSLERYVERIFVLPPSAHERAESLLALADWLEGKVPPKKRLRLLGLE